MIHDIFIGLLFFVACLIVSFVGQTITRCFTDNKWAIYAGGFALCFPFALAVLS